MKKNIYIYIYKSLGDIYYIYIYDSLGYTSEINIVNQLYSNKIHLKK